MPAAQFVAGVAILARRPGRYGIDQALNAQTLFDSHCGRTSGSPYNNDSYFASPKRMCSSETKYATLLGSMKFASSSLEALHSAD